MNVSLKERQRERGPYNVGSNDTAIEVDVQTLGESESDTQSLRVSSETILAQCSGNGMCD